jgi:hypothetical protein
LKQQRVEHEVFGPHIRKKGAQRTPFTFSDTVDYHSGKRCSLGMNILSPAFTPKASYQASI